jgi:hypothetical protein
MNVKILELFNVMRVDHIHFYKDPSDTYYTLHTRKTMFRTEYNTYIPIKSLTECEFNEIMSDEKNTNQLIYKTYKNKKETPIIHKIREEAIEYLKSTNRLKQN